MYSATHKTFSTLLGRMLAAAGVVALMGVSLQAQAGPLPTQAVNLVEHLWSEFDVDSALAPVGGLDWIDSTASNPLPLSFNFTIANGFVGTLTVVDAGFAGDMFNVFNGTTQLGTTSSVAVTIVDNNPPFTVDFDEAFANSTHSNLALRNFSSATFNLGAGSYAIRGTLAQSVLGFDQNNVLQPLNSTSGGIRLDVSPVPEPESLAMLLAGMGLVGAALRRRA